MATGVDQDVQGGCILEGVVGAQDEVLGTDDVRAAGRDAGDAPSLPWVMASPVSKDLPGPTASSSPTPSKSSSPMLRCADASSTLTVSGWGEFFMWGASWSS